MAHAMPFVAMTACLGIALDAARPALTAQAWQHIAARLGRLTAQLHSLPLPAGHLFSAGGAAAPFTLWQGRAGLDLSFRPAGAEAGGTQALLEHLGLQQKVDSVDGTACVRLSSVADDSWPLTNGNQEAAVEETPDTEGARRLWRPFADFLRERRRSAPGELAWEHSLPRRLLDQLEEYLPPDPAAFLPAACADALPDLRPCDNDANCTSRRSVEVQNSDSAPGGSIGSLPAPSWLHGDLIAQNILVSEAFTAGADWEQHASKDGLAQDAVQLIDFGDTGHGDPLYDLVLLLVEALR